MVKTTKKINHEKFYQQERKSNSDSVRVVQSRKLNHKLFLLSLKYIPIILAVGCFLSTLFQYFGIDEIITTELCFTGFIVSFFLISASVVFKFCAYHRIYLYYIILNELLVIINYYFSIIDDKMFVRFLLILFFIATIVRTILYLYAKQNSNTTKSVTEND